MLRLLALLAVSVAAEYAYSGNAASMGMQAVRQAKTEVQKRVISYELAEAVFERSPDILKIRDLISKGSDPNDGSNPLYTAVDRNNLLAAEELLSYGADPNAKLNSETYGSRDPHNWYRHGYAPLHRAITHDSYFFQTPNLKMVELLLKYEADIEIKDRDNRTPFLRAVSIRRLDIAQLLTNRGADVHAKTKGGENAMHLLVAEAARAEIRYGDDPTDLPIDDFINMAEFLVSLGVDINAPDNEGKTPLQALVSQTFRSAAYSFLVKFPFSGHDSPSHQQLVTFFIENGADPDIADHNGITPMAVDLVLREGLLQC